MRSLAQVILEFFPIENFRFGVVDATIYLGSGPGSIVLSRSHLPLLLGAVTRPSKKQNLETWVNEIFLTG